MRALIVVGVLTVTSLASQTAPASAQRWCGSLASGSNCHIGASAAVQACTQKYVAAKKAAQLAGGQSVRLQPSGSRRASH
jgi:hypothetical protein